MARDLPEKLRLTAALLGCSTRKELAAEFRKANAATAFDLERSYKWLQGRAAPRHSRVYGEWLAILRLDRSPGWLIDCSAADFLDSVCRQHKASRDDLARRAEEFAGRSTTTAIETAIPSGGHDFLCGAFAAYRPAFSPYYRGRLLRASLVIEPEARGGLRACYIEGLAVGMVRAVGAIEIVRGCLWLDLRCTNGEGPVFMCLVAPAPPATFIAGMLCDAALMAPQPQPSTARIAFVRVGGAGRGLLEPTNRCMEEGETIGADLASLGVGSGAHPVETQLDPFLRGAADGGIDSMRADQASPFASHFDQLWIAQTTAQRGSAADLAKAEAAPRRGSQPRRVRRHG